MPTTDNCRIEMFAVPDVPLVSVGDDTGRVIGDAIERAGFGLVAGDIVVVAQKVISKAEGRYVDLDEIVPSDLARRVAEEIGKDPALVEVILSQSREIVRKREGLLIVENTLGIVMANAGIDVSNVGPGSQRRVLLLPEDPDGTCRRLRHAWEQRFDAPLAVLIADSVGRAWRNGVVGIAVGASGCLVLENIAGRRDLFGYTLQTTEVAIGDQIAAAATLLMGQADEGYPVVIVRGLRARRSEQSAGALLRSRELDLFR